VRDPDPELAHPEAAGWVLGTLDPGDAEWFAGHMPSCPDCRAAVAEFGPAARLLATAAPADLAPPGLQARTLAGVHLPEPGSGQFYQCWWVGPGNGPGHPRLVSAGTFTVRPSRTATVQLWTAADPDDFSTIEITLDSAAQPGQPGHVVLSGTVNDD
jgi:anti-sigma factor RsiW